jgi:hypothetical protein
MEPKVLPPAARRPGRRALLALLPAIFLWAAGCDTGPRSVLSGKVTLSGQPVSGSLTFVGPDAQEVTVPINPEGTYNCPNPPGGDVKVLVKGFDLPRVVAVPAAAKRPKLPDTPGAGPQAVGVRPPARYGLPGNALTVNVQGGKQTYDITLKP